MKINGRTVSTTMLLPDWNETDERSTAFIRNKPITIPAVSSRHEGMHLKVVDGAWTPVYESEDGSSYMFLNDTEKAYKKVVPTNVMQYTMIDKIGGGTPYTRYANLLDFDTVEKISGPTVSRTFRSASDDKVKCLYVGNNTTHVEESSINIQSLLLEAGSPYTFHFRGSTKVRLKRITTTHRQFLYDDASTMQEYAETFVAEDGEKITGLNFSLHYDSGAGGYVYVQLVQGREVPDRFSAYYGNKENEYVIPKVTSVKAEGKNILPTLPEFAERNANGPLFMEYNSDGSITLNGSSTAGISLFIYGNEKEASSAHGKGLFLAPGTYCTNTRRDDGVSLIIKPDHSTWLNGTFTLYESDEYYSLGYIVYLNVPAGLTFDNETIYPFIVKGSTSLSTWEPYRGGAIEIPEAVQALDGYGVEGNYIDLDKKTFVNSETGVTTDISSLWPDIESTFELKSGDTITFENKYKDSVESEVTYQIKL